MAAAELVLFFADAEAGCASFFDKGSSICSGTRFTGAGEKPRRYGTLEAMGAPVLVP